jgi:SAM-dependent MidA family methyltransferase
MTEVEALQRLLLDRLAKHGPMPFAAFMQLALYHPQHGYYASARPRTGWAGDFVTSPELDPAFGELWARGFEQIWSRCGRPEHFEVVEVGPGEGSFAQAVLQAAAGDFAEALSYRLVERQPPVQERQHALLARFDRVWWSDSIVDVPPVEFGVLFANEVLDNLPVHLVENESGRLHEVCVVEKNGSLAFALLPPSSPELERFLERSEVSVPDGHRMEVSLATESFMARAAALVGRGAVVIVDYGDEAARLARRPRGSLACYSPAGADDDPLAAPGEKDITVHVNWTALRAAGRRAGLEMTGPVEQREVLLALGLEALDLSLQEGGRDALSRKEGAAAVALLSRRQALRVLVDRGGLGSLGVLVGSKGISPPDFVAAALR